MNGASQWFVTQVLHKKHLGGLWKGPQQEFLVPQAGQGPENPHDQKALLRILRSSYRSRPLASILQALRGVVTPIRNLQGPL